MPPKGKPAKDAPVEEPDPTEEEQEGKVIIVVECTSSTPLWEKPADAPPDAPADAILAELHFAGDSKESQVVHLTPAGESELDPDNALFEYKLRKMFLREPGIDTLQELVNATLKLTLFNASFLDPKQGTKSRIPVGEVIVDLTPLVRL
eukprot:7504653-Pyramimonas_sp.AAC.1